MPNSDPGLVQHAGVARQDPGEVRAGQHGRDLEDQLTGVGAGRQFAGPDGVAHGLDELPLPFPYHFRGPVARPPGACRQLGHDAREKATAREHPTLQVREKRVGQSPHPPETRGRLPSRGQDFPPEDLGRRLDRGQFEFLLRHYAASPYPLTVAVADFNGDGAPDIATKSEIMTSNMYSSIDVLLGYGDGTFASPVSQPLGAGTYAGAQAAGDFDGDGLPDVVAITAAPRTSVLINAGGWVFPATLAIGDVTVTEGGAANVNATFMVTRRENLDTTAKVS